MKMAVQGLNKRYAKCTIAMSSQILIIQAGFSSYCALSVMQYWLFCSLFTVDFIIVSNHNHDDAVNIIHDCIEITMAH